MKNTQTILFLWILLIGLFPVLSFAQEEDDPAKAAQNPLANVYSLPLQNNTDFGIGEFN